MSDETIEQPTKIKMQDFDVVHKQIALEQQLNKLKPFIAVSYTHLTLPTICSV